MRMISQSLFLSVLFVLINSLSQANDSTKICIDRIDGLGGPDTIIAGDTIRFRVAFVNHTPVHYQVQSIFRVYSRATLTSGDHGSGTATWRTTPPVNRRPFYTFDSGWVNTGPLIDTVGGFSPADFPYRYLFRCLSCDGEGVDSLQFSGFVLYTDDVGMPPNDSVTAFTISLVTRRADTGKVICIDSSSFFAQFIPWRWIPYTGDGTWPEQHPNWDGPHCFVLKALTPENCCRETTGNLDCSTNGRADIADLVALIDYLYISFRPVCCMKAANIDGDPAGGVDISDLSSFIDYMYINFSPVAPCR